MKKWRYSLVVALGFPLILVFLAFLLGFFLESFLGQAGIFLLFFPGILVGTWFAGKRTGFLATLLSSFLASYLLIKGNSLSGQFSGKDLIDITQPAFVIPLIEFYLEGIFVSYIIDFLRKTDLVNQANRKMSEQDKKIGTLRGQVTSLQSEIKSRDEFLSIASHELKTPLTSMLLQLQTALHNIRNVSLANFSVENLLKMLESAESQTTRLSKMINDLLNISLMTTRKLELDLEEVDLSELTKNVIGNFSEKLSKEGQSLSFEPEEKIIGQMDKVRVEQVVTNLISNAIKYGNKKPIEIRVTNSGLTGKIVVKDQGIGIPKDRRNKIFSLFERAAPANKYEGLGVGLYITNQIVKAHQGRIRVESRENEGSTFTVELPLRK